MGGRGSSKSPFVRAVRVDGAIVCIDGMDDWSGGMDEVVPAEPAERIARDHVMDARAT